MARRGPDLATLSREISRLAAELAVLVAPDGAAPPPTPALARAVLAMRLDARRLLPGLGEPAVNMLLALYAVRLEVDRGDGRALCPTSLAALAEVTETTALNWLKPLVARGLVRRRPDLRDRRIVRLSLTPHGIAGVEAYLAAIGERARMAAGEWPLPASTPVPAE